MAAINYQFADGHCEDIEVTEDFKREYMATLDREQRIERKETRRHLSLDYLMELEDQQHSWGDLENKSLQMKQETFSLISSNPDPLEILIQREREESLPVMEALAESKDLTDYQRKVAIEFYINNKTQTQIAKELATNKMAICRVLKKVREQVLKSFV
ncbi:MAG: hypothetical protein FWE84_00770 [Firmicutes bacterium]|nr:hypothetical protein [Bacillota bacterium]